MDNMEHAIEHAAQVIAPALEGHGMEHCSESGPNVHRRWIQCSCDEAVEYAEVPAWEAHRAQVAARALADAGLLAPAPLHVELRDSGDLGLTPGAFTQSRWATAWDDGYNAGKNDLRDNRVFHTRNPHRGAGQ